MERWQIYLYCIYAVVILEAFYIDKKKLAVCASLFFSMATGMINYACYGLYTGIFAFIIMLAPGLVGAAMKKSGVLKKVLGKEDEEEQIVLHEQKKSIEAVIASNDLDEDSLANYLDDKGNVVANTWNEQMEEKADEDVEHGKTILMIIVGFFVFISFDVRLYAALAIVVLGYFKQRIYLRDKKILWPRSLTVVKKYYDNILHIGSVWFYCMVLLGLSVIATNRLWWKPAYMEWFYACTIVFPAVLSLMLNEIISVHDCWAARYQAKTIGARFDRYGNAVNFAKQRPDYSVYFLLGGCALAMNLNDNTYAFVPLIVAAVFAGIQSMLWQESYQAREK